MKIVYNTNFTLKRVFHFEAATIELDGQFHLTHLLLSHVVTTNKKQWQNSSIEFNLYTFEVLWLRVTNCKDYCKIKDTVFTTFFILVNCLQVINNGRVFERNRVTELVKDSQTMRQKEVKVNTQLSLLVSFVCQHL